MSKSCIFLCVASVLALWIVCQAQGFYSPYPHPCDRNCPKIYRPVCASNFVTYPNECVFDEENCKRPPWAKLRILFRGECPFYY